MEEEKILAKEEFESYLNNLGNKMVIIWFSAPWCAPCRKIKSTCEKKLEEINKLNNKNIDIFQINVDDHLELFGWLKTKRMVPGIPSIIAYYGDVNRELWYAPDDSVSGANEKEVKDFFDRCMMKSIDYSNNENELNRPKTAPP